MYTSSNKVVPWQCRPLILVQSRPLTMPPPHIGTKSSPDNAAPSYWYKVIPWQCSPLLLVQSHPLTMPPPPIGTKSSADNAAPSYWYKVIPWQCPPPPPIVYKVVPWQCHVLLLVQSHPLANSPYVMSPLFCLFHELVYNVRYYYIYTRLLNIFTSFSCICKKLYFLGVRALQREQLLILFGCFVLFLLLLLLTETCPETKT